MLLVRRRPRARSCCEWFNEQREEQLDALLRQAPVSRLEEAASEVDRIELFRQGLSGLQRVPRAGSRPDRRQLRLRAAHFARPLYVLAAAYLARTSADADVDALGEAELLRKLLDQHEAESLGPAQINSAAWAWTRLTGGPRSPSRPC